LSERTNLYISQEKIIYSVKISKSWCFLEPVNVNHVVDYYEIITNPIGNKNTFKSLKNIIIILY